MSRSSLSVVTGAFGYSGKYIARRLLEQGGIVKTLTRTPISHSPFGDRVRLYLWTSARQLGQPAVQRNVGFL